MQKKTKGVRLTVSKFNLFQIGWLIALALLAAYYLVAGRIITNETGIFLHRTSLNLVVANSLILFMLAAYNTCLGIAKRAADHSPLVCTAFLLCNLFYLDLAAFRVIAIPE